MLAPFQLSHLQATGRKMKLKHLLYPYVKVTNF